MLGIELLNGIIKILIIKAWTNFAVDQTTLNLVPILSIIHSLLQPVWVISQSVLLIPSSGQGLTGSFVGHDEGHDGEAKQDHNQQEHHNQVDPQEPGDSAARAYEAGQGDDH